MAKEELPDEDLPKVDQVRRRLLRILVYSPPAILGVVSMTQDGCQPASCGPQNCMPNGGCPPNCMPLNCLPASTRIATPLGEVAVSLLQPGALVWTIDAAGARVAAPVVLVRSLAAPASHRVLRVTLADGRVVTGSAGHPTGDGRLLGALCPGQRLDGAPIVAIERVPLGGDATWDLLPDGATGVYWADGVCLGSTLVGLGGTTVPVVCRAADGDGGWCAA